jgi:DNA-binding NarL/FixJ family response regulator
MPIFKSQKKRVLIVDDHTMIVDMLCTCLNEEGYEPVAANSASQALQQMQRYPCDVVLMDVKMPDEDGIVLLEKFRKRFPGAPVIMLSGVICDDAMVKKAMELGASAFLSKGAHLKPILEAIEMALKV